MLTCADAKMSKKISNITYKANTFNENNNFYDGKLHKKLEVKVIVRYETMKEDIKECLMSFTHQNIQKLYCYESNALNHYYAFQNYDKTLKDYFGSNIKKHEKLDLMEVTRNIANGLKYLHENKIVHGNINMNNIGIDFETKNAILLNCGLEYGKDDLFKSPEELISAENSTTGSDIFSFGILIYSIFTDGNHLFVSKIENIKNEFDFSIFVPGKHFKNQLYQQFCAISLLESMLIKESNNRCSIQHVLEHPFMLSLQGKKDYLTKINLLLADLSKYDVQNINLEAKDKLGVFGVNHDMDFLIRQFYKLKFNKYLKTYPHALHVTYEIEPLLQKLVSKKHESENFLESTQEQFSKHSSKTNHQIAVKNNKKIEESNEDINQSTDLSKELSSFVESLSEVNLKHLKELQVVEFKNFMSSFNQNLAKFINSATSEYHRVRSIAQCDDNDDLDSFLNRTELSNDFVYKRTENIKPIPTNHFKEEISDDSGFLGESFTASTPKKSEIQAKIVSKKSSSRQILSNMPDKEDTLGNLIKKSTPSKKSKLKKRVKSDKMTKNLDIQEIKNIMKDETTDKNPFNMLLWNVRSMTDEKLVKLYEILNTLACRKDGSSYGTSIDMIVLVEFWKKTKDFNCFPIKGYFFVAIQRKNSRGGGIALYIKNDYEFRVNDDYSIISDNYEMILVEILRSGVKIQEILAVYCPDTSKIDKVEKFVKQMDEILLKRGQSLIILGDTNINTIDTTNPDVKTNLYLKTLKRHKFEIKNKAITRENTNYNNHSLIDHVIANKNNDQIFALTLEKIPEFDHNAIFILNHQRGLINSNNNLSLSFDDQNTYIKSTMKDSRVSQKHKTFKNLSFKEIERKLYEKIKLYVPSDQVEETYQYGFAKREGCIDLIAKLVAVISTAIDEYRSVKIMHYDLSSAYKFFNKNMLCERMEELEFDEEFIEITYAYLSTDNKTLNNDTSDCLDSIKYGIQQATAIKHFLFSIYLSKFKFPTTNSMAFKYCDEIVLLLEFENVDNVDKKVDEDKKILNNYLRKNFPTSTFKPQIEMLCRGGIKSSEGNDKINCFGIIIDANLNFINHYHSVKEKLIFAINDMKIYHKNKLELYIHSFQAQLSYASFLLLRLRRNEYFQKLQELQHEALKIVYGVKELISTENLFRKYAVNMLPVMGVLFYDLCRLVHKSLYQPSDHLFNIESTHSDRKELLIMKKASILIKRNDTEIIGASIFNSLPENTRKITNEKEFKLSLKRLLVTLSDSLVKDKIKERRSIINPN